MKEANDMLQPLDSVQPDTLQPIAETSAPILGNVGKASYPLHLQKLMKTRLLIQAASGGGKSYALRRIIEQTHGQVQQIVIDPEGELATLADKFPFLLCSAESETAPLHVDTAAMLAETIYRSGQSVILSIGGFDVEEMQDFVAGFMLGLMRQPKEYWHYCMVAVDEAQLFAPQQDKAESKKPMLDLVARGRKRGLCPVVATQRLSQLHKGVVAHLDNKLIGLTTLDNDVERAAEQLGMKPAKAASILRGLDSGEFLAYGPALSYEISKVKVGKVETSHGVLEDFDATPNAPAMTRGQLEKAIAALAGVAVGPCALPAPSVKVGGLPTVGQMRHWVIAPLLQNPTYGAMTERCKQLGLQAAQAQQWLALFAKDPSGKSLEPARVGRDMARTLERLAPLMIAQPVAV
ncbi:DUF87 domain-containing protein [Polaromonas sp.]|jgi:hypothetical protein|uniref:ATP-binding protein n=2 Tax=Polaromonas TaxID=52972 RepID=UPI000BD13427|nr:DUF87 domain-containing protein [Polaromonas sp.]OYZ79727.1 MAG: hypothetical protein B7Y09_09400 [Polaromonas sp. 24-63-21]OZA47307.1 MAG: hypothetical protein B7X88_22670 [Polaromonas sp. 17-63-33]HQS00763.1 DUF87 domain-containing protein [Polaromonas sp.]HQS38944.1 DUF87 domain-containing protein [Polaromonas sp.]HQT09798.1 DUF87 domain-containing protein [Polaromonas sp.]